MKKKILFGVISVFFLVFAAAVAFADSAENKSGIKTEVEKDYINAHQKEYEDIIAMGDAVLPHLYSIWETDSGLRGVVALTAIFDIRPEINIHAAQSPDGKYRAETKGIDFDNPISGLYPAEEIRIIERSAQKIVWSITPGYLDTDFCWSPDSRYVAISYMARLYRDTIIIDTYDMSLINVPQENDLWPLIGSHSEPEANRPDPYFSIVGWVNSTSIRISFKWAGKDENKYAGEFVYDLANKQVLEMRLI